MATIGKRIKARREALGMTQEELAKKLGYKSKTTIAKIELGVNDISQSKVVEFAKALNTNILYLIGQEDEETITLTTATAEDKDREKMLALYKNIKNRREELGLTKVELANRVGYERSMITKVEQGKVDLTQSKIVAFAEALHTTPAYLMGWEDEDLKRMIKMYNALPEDKKKTIRQIVEDYYNTFA